MGNPVAMFEIISTDHARAQAFYTDLFGWEAHADPGMGGYALVDTHGGEGAIGGAIGPSQAPGDTGVKVYVRVDSLETFLARAAELGATTILPPMELPDGNGRCAIFADPDGNPVGLWE